MCKVLYVTRSGFYAWLGRGESKLWQVDARLQPLIRSIYDSHRLVYGVPRVHQALKKSGETCSRKRVARLMRSMDLRSKATRRFKVKTTDSHHGHPIAPDLLQRNVTGEAPNRVWVTDITYSSANEGWL